MLEAIAQESLREQRLLNKNDSISQRNKPSYTYQSIRALQPDRLALKIAELNKTDNELLLQNDKIGNASKKKSQTPKVMTKLEQEIVREFEEPIGYEYQDPRTGETKYRKYQTLEPPQLYDDDVGLPEFDNYVNRIIPDEEMLYVKQKKNVDQQHYLDDLQRLEEEYLETDRVYKQYEELINLGGQNKKERKEVNRIFNNLRIKKEAIRNAIESTRTEVDNFSREYELIDAKRKEHNALVQNQKRENLEIIQDYQRRLNLLNSGAFNTTKMENETEEDYLNRLQRNAEIDVPEDALEKAKNKTLVAFREKLKEITRDPVKIDQIANSFDVEDKIQLLKLWVAIKDKYNKTYGLLNNKIESEVIVEFLKFAIHKLTDNSPSIIKDIFEEEVPIAEMGREGLIAEPYPAENTLVVRKPSISEQPPLYLRGVLLSGRPESHNNKLVLIYSFTGQQGTFKEYFDEAIPSTRITKGVSKLKSSDEIRDKTGITDEDINRLAFQNQRISNKLNPSTIVRKLLIEQYRIMPVSVADTIQTNYSVYVNRPKDRIEYGMGIHKKVEPKLVPFGNVSINYSKLKYENTLSIKTHQGKSIGGLPNKKISEKLTSVIMNMIEHINPTQDEINRLSLGEREIYDRLIYLGKLHKTLPNTNDKTINDLKKRLKLLEAEIEIGNNNPQIKRDISTILHSLRDFKVITQGNLNKYLKQL
jgi:hypothetical protein